MAKLILNSENMYNNMLAYFKMASAEQIEHGKTWYFQAHDECVKLSAETGYDLATVCGVVSALSPRCRWELNIKYARTLLQTGDVKGAVLGLSVAKAKRIMAGEEIRGVLSGPKTCAFYWNILCPECDKHSTQDTWMGKAFWGLSWDGNIRAGAQYDMMHEACDRVAKEHKLLPQQVQAIVWVVIREIGSHPTLHHLAVN